MANTDRPAFPLLSYIAAQPGDRALQFSREAPAPCFQRFERDGGIDIASDAGIGDDLDHLLAIGCGKSGDFHFGNPVNMCFTSSLAQVTQNLLREDDERHEAFEEKRFAFGNKYAPEILGLIVHLVFLY
ncbi:hypothetical protein [Paraburkholderia hospita]|uniref:hypothetical protein n=1 Tax=Paraburkholderia hospita TaxID=169430 RepID=UPI001054ADE5|nr:hypothetical protein [Paraburkholderia hospita]